MRLPCVDDNVQYTIHIMLALLFHGSVHSLYFQDFYGRATSKNLNENMKLVASSLRILSPPDTVFLLQTPIVIWYRFRTVLNTWYLLGRFPREVHMHVRRHDIKDLPTDDEGLQEVRLLTLCLSEQNCVWECFFS